MAKPTKTKNPESPIGNKGYTLLEILLTVSVLSMAMAYIFPAFFKSADLSANVSSRLQADLLVNNLCVKAEADLRRDGTLSDIPVRGRAELGGKIYDYVVQSRKQNSTGTLYALEVAMEWHDFKKNALHRTFYVFR